MVAIAWQSLVVLLPDIPGYFESHGIADLERRISLTQRILVVELVVTALLGTLALHWLGALASSGRKAREVAVRVGTWVRRTSLQSGNENVWTLEPEHMEASDLIRASAPRASLSPRKQMLCEGIVIALKLLCVVVSLVLHFVWPSRRNQVVVLAFASAYNFGVSNVIYGFSFFGNCFIVACTFVLGVVVLNTGTFGLVPNSFSQTSFSLQEAEAFRNFQLTWVVGELTLLLLSLGSARAWGLYERSLWRREVFLKQELGAWEGYQK